MISESTLPITSFTHTCDDNGLFFWSIGSAHEITPLRKCPVIYVTNAESAGSKLPTLPAPHVWLAQVAQQKGCIIPRGTRRAGVTARSGVSALHPLSALSACLYFFELPARNFLGLKATGPKGARKL